MSCLSIILFHLTSLASFFGFALAGLEIRGGILVYILIYTFSFCRMIFNKMFMPKLNWLDIFVIAYVMWSLMTLINVIILEKPIDVYIKGVSYTILPVIGYFLFSFYCGNELNEYVNRYIKVVVISSLVAIVVGVIPCFTNFEFYFKYVVKMSGDGFNENSPLWLARLISYFGDPAALGNMSVVSLPLVIYLRSQKYKHFSSPIIFITLISILIIGTVLSFARSAWVAAFVILCTYFMYATRTHYIKTLCVLVIIVVSYCYISEIEQSSNTLLYSLFARARDMAGAFSERHNQIEYALNTISENPLGVGLGQVGHKAISSGSVKLGVSDNNYLKIFTETGIIGFNLFICICATTICISFKCFLKYRFRDKLSVAIGCVIFIYLFQSIGTNIMDLYYTSFLFWTFVGILSIRNKHTCLLSGNTESSWI